MKITLAILITAAVTAGLAFGFRGYTGSAAAGPPAPVRIEPAAKGDLIEFITAPGLIEPKTKVAISARVSARITQLPCEEGTEVTRGGADTPPSLLVKLDSTDLEAALKSTQARRDAQAAGIEVEKVRIEGQGSDLKALEVEYAQALRGLDRQKGLLTTKDVSQSAVDDLQSTADQLQARIESTRHAIASSQKNLIVLGHNIDAADAEIARAKDDLAYTTIVSPIDGTVIKLNSEVGELAIVGVTNSPGTTILEVADLSQMLLNAQVDEADIGGVKLGQHARVRIQAYPERIFDGSVTAIALTATEQPTKHFEVEILLDTKGDRIFSGLTADVDIEIAEHKALFKVPSQAVMGRLVDDLPADVTKDNPNVDSDKTITAVVYRVVDGKAVVTPVKIGPSDITHTVILGGLNEGDPIVVGPYKVLEGLTHQQNVVDEKNVTEEERRAYLRNAGRQFDPNRREDQRGPR